MFPSIVVKGAPMSSNVRPFRSFSVSSLGRCRIFARALVWALVFSLALPLPMAGSASARDGDATSVTPAAQNMPVSARNSDDGAAHVLRRLNSPERARAIEEAVRRDAAARAAAAQETAAPSVADRVAAPATGVSPTVRPEQRQTAASAQRPLATGSPATTGASSVSSAAPAAPTASASAQRPKTVTEVLFNGVTGFMGLPGLTGSAYDPYDPNADQGLGFHQDGTARRADGTTGNSAASGNYDGRRAAAYAGHGLGYGQYGSFGAYGAGDPLGYYGVGYDPLTDYNYRLGDPTRGGRQAANRMGGYGGDMFSGPDYFYQRGLNYGAGLLNSAGEAALSGLVDGGRARLNFMIDLKGRINGEGDVLYPFWDSQYTTVYTQLGARSMSGMDSGDRDDGTGADRWIGNAGLGQRWFPLAEDVNNAGNLMLGYNAFFDYDFTRSHQRGGFGVEAQYDWIRLASNYYFPISSWRDSKDFDGDFVKERPAQGWDVRAKGYMPFYRNLAVTGAYSQWYGDHVGMFSTSKLEKDPKVWSYGLEYTPVPLVSGFINQRSTENGRSDTEFGLRFTYHFNMPWEDQISHAKVAELRTVSGSKHEFVDRENRIILEYKAKNSYRIEYLGPDGNGFLFRVRDGFGKYVAGQTVRVTTSGTYLAEAAPAGPPSLFARVMNFLDDLIAVKAAYAAGFASRSYVTDGQGRFWVQLDPSAPNPLTVTMAAGDNSQNFTLAGGSASSYTYGLGGLTVTSATGALGGVIVVTNTSDGTPAANVSVSIPLSYRTSGGSGTAASTTITISGTTNASGEIAASGTVSALTRDVQLSADNYATSVVHQVRGGGQALPAPFITGPSLNLLSWDNTTNPSALNYCASHGGQLPTRTQLQAVSAGSAPANWPAGGAGAAGSYWTGEAVGPGSHWDVDLIVGFASAVPVDYTFSVVCVP